MGKKILEANAELSYSYIMACKLEVTQKQDDPEEVFQRIHQILLNSGRSELSDSFYNHIFNDQ